LGARAVVRCLFGGGARARALSEARLEGRFDSARRTSAGLFGGSCGRSTAGFEGDPAGSDASAGQATQPFGVARPGGVQTANQAGSRRAEGAGDKTLEADQGHERVPDRFIATRQLGHRTPRRVRLVTKSRYEAHGGSAQPIRREMFGVETLKSRSTLEEDHRSVATSSVFVGSRGFFERENPGARSANHL
jgi:hypothetical protein